MPESIRRLLAGDEINSNGKTKTPVEMGLKMQSDDDLLTHPGEVEGQRNETLCRLIGRWIKTSGVNAELLDAAVDWGRRCSPPMELSEVSATVANIASKEQSKGVPTSSSATTSAMAAKSTLDVTPFSEIEPQDVEWLWQDRIPLGKLILVVGEPGLGKTFACIDMAARVSKGANFPDGSPTKAGDVLILTCEDGPEDTLRPRLDKHDADVAHVFNVNGAKQVNGDVAFISLKSHLATLSEFFSAYPNLRLLIIDPISAFLGDKCDSHNNSAVRAVLGPVCELAERHKVAIVGITHLSKGYAKAINRVIGSIAFVAAARAAWLVARDDDDEGRRLFLPIKNNLAQTTGLAFRITDGRCEWEDGEVLVSADDIGDENETPRDEAKRWLENALIKPMPAKWIFQQSRADGISEKTLKRAKKELGIISDRIGEAWLWRLPEQKKPDIGDDVFIVT